MRPGSRTSLIILISQSAPVRIKRPAHIIQGCADLKVEFSSLLKLHYLAAANVCFSDITAMEAFQMISWKEIFSVHREITEKASDGQSYL